MKKTHSFLRLLCLLAAVILTAIIARQNNCNATEVMPHKPEASTIVPPHHPYHNEATLTDATQLYRICSPRPQRLLPSNGAKNERTASLYGFARKHFVKLPKFFYDSNWRPTTSPLALPASRNNYFIALRHILR